MSAATTTRQAPASSTIGSKSAFTDDLVASLVVFLVALPLCMGIAIASGVPPALGIVTGIIGGIVVGAISGSPLQVSGPAAGMAVIVFEAVRQFGLPMLGVIVLGAGALQFAAARFKLGRLFRAISPAVCLRDAGRHWSTHHRRAISRHGRRQAARHGTR